MKEKGKGRAYRSPLEYFREHYGNMKITRDCPPLKDKGLLRALKKYHQLDEAIPEMVLKKQVKAYRGYASPLECYRELYKDVKDMTRMQLSRENKGLYIALQKTNLLDYAIPVKSKKVEAMYKSYGDALKYFRKEYLYRRLKKQKDKPGTGKTGNERKTRKKRKK